MEQKVLLLPCSSYSAPELKSCLELILKEFAQVLPRTGAKVLLKPNMVKALSRESCGTTDPVFIEVLIECGLERGWQISVGDSPAIGSLEQAARANGLYDILKRQNIPLLQLSGNEHSALDDRDIYTAPQLKTFDALINVPKLKGHRQLYFTGATKNLFGCMAGKRKVWQHMHLSDRESGLAFAQMLLDHANKVAPCLNIMDGIRAMAGPGPIHGKPVFEGLIAASANFMALDLAVFEHLGGEIDEDPLMILQQRKSPKTPAQLLFPLGRPPRGAFYFPTREQRAPISFRPWVLLRLMWREFMSQRTKGKTLPR